MFIVSVIKFNIDLTRPTHTFRDSHGRRCHGIHVQSFSTFSCLVSSVELEETVEERNLKRESRVNIRVKLSGRMPRIRG